MALSTAVGSFTQPGSTGNQSVTGLSFQPKLVIFFSNYRGSDGSQGGLNFAIGCGVSSSDRRCIFGEADDNQTVNGNGPESMYIDNTKCIGYRSADHQANARAVADFVSMNADGFTVNWTTTDASSLIINYIAIGGSDVTNVQSGQFTQPTSTGNSSVTGVGFQPDSILLFRSVKSTSAPPQSDRFNQVYCGIGFGKSSSSRANTSGDNSRSGANSVDKSYQVTSSVFSTIGGAGTKTDEADLVSLDSDGFTLNWTTTSGANYAFYIAIKGGSFGIGSFNQPTTTGSSAVTGVGFQPKGLLLLSDGLTTSSSVQANHQFSMGAMDGTNRGHIFFGSLDNQTTYRKDINLDRTKAIKLFTPVGSGGPTLNSAADITSFDSDGFTLNWTTADATAREILYLAFGSNAVASSFRQFRMMMGIGI